MSTAGTAQTAPPTAQLTQQFMELAAALAPGSCLKADYTPLGRGLVATAPVAAGTPMLAVDWANMLCVTDDPSKPAGSTFGKRVLQDWQLLHGKIPPLLSSYLLKGVPPSSFAARLCWAGRSRGLPLSCLLALPACCFACLHWIHLLHAVLRQSLKPARHVPPRCWLQGRAAGSCG